MKVIVGLGNPGKEYARTPHNAGFLVTDELAGRWGASLRRSLRFPARLAKARRGEENLLLAQPQTYMNLSGGAVSAIAARHGIAPEDVLVVLDDADLPLGQIRIRKAGSAGGHKGLQSILQALRTDGVPRVRVGIGRGSGGVELVTHVLEPLRGGEWESLRAAVRRAADAIEAILDRGVDRAMNEFNARAEARDAGTES